MIRPISDMPAGVLGFEAVGDIETDDYANVMVPAVEEAIEQHGKVRIVYMLGPEFEEYEAGAKWEGRQAGRTPPGILRAHGDRHRRRMGAACDQGHQRALAWEARAFPLAELEAAKRWAAAEADDRRD